MEKEFSDLVDDLSVNFNSISGRLRNSNGTFYLDFKKQLQPKYQIVWFHLSSAYIILIGLFMLAWLLQTASLVAHISYVVLAMALIGYTIAYIALFMHEAAHYNIAPNKVWNDRLANLFIGVLTGTDISSYRPTHFIHHREIGKPEDPEYFYFLPFNVKLLVKSVTGVTLLESIVKRFKNDRSVKRLSVYSQPVDDYRKWGVPLAGLVVHGLIFFLNLFGGTWFFAVAWGLGMGVVWPFFAVLRPILEHRSESASEKLDYFKVSHGSVTRVFGEGPVASTLGGAGFNRHLLHHWQPQISYTRFSELERFLLDTEAGPILRSRQTTYLAVTRLLFGR